MHQFDLKKKTAVITGGAQGFGLDIAKKFLIFWIKGFIMGLDAKELIKALLLYLMIHYDFLRSQQ